MTTELVTVPLYWLDLADSVGQSLSAWLRGIVSDYVGGPFGVYRLEPAGFALVHLPSCRRLAVLHRLRDCAAAVNDCPGALRSRVLQ